MIIEIKESSRRLLEKNKLLNKQTKTLSPLFMFF